MDTPNFQACVGHDHRGNTLHACSQCVMGKKKKKIYLENSFYFEYVFKDFEFFFFFENLKIKKPKINNIYI